MEAEKLSIENAISHFEKLYDQGYGWMKEITEIKDGLNKIEREVIRSLINNGGSVSAGILVGEVISRLVYVEINEIKSEIVRMLNQSYPLISREFLLGKPYFTSERISLTELGKSIKDTGNYYLYPLLPVYFIQEKIRKWDRIQLSRLSFEKNSFLNYLKNILLNLELSNDENYLKFKLPKKTRINESFNIIKELNLNGKVNVYIESSYEFNRFLNSLKLYDVPVGFNIITLLEFCSDKGLEVTDIISTKDDITEISIKIKSDIKSDELLSYLSELGYTQNIEHSYYLIDEDGELFLGSFDYLIDYWKNSILKDKKSVLDLIEKLLDDCKSLCSDNENEFIRIWDDSKEKKVIVNNCNDILISNCDEKNIGKYSFNITSEDVVLVTDNCHVRVSSDMLLDTITNMKEDPNGIRVLGAFPMGNTFNKDRVFYFINQKGFVKASKESDLFTRSTKVVSTEVERDEEIIKILCNDFGKDSGHIVFITKKGYVKVLHVSELKPKNRASKYVLGLRLSEDDCVLKSFFIKDDFNEIHLKLIGKDCEKEVKFKDYEIVTSKLNRGRLIKGIKYVEDVIILNKEIISDNVFE